MKEKEAIKFLKEKGYSIILPEKQKTIIIENTEYELEQHDNNKLLSEIKIPKGWRLLKPWEAQRLWDLGYLRDGWIYVENTCEEKKKKGNVTRFNANSDWAILNCSRIPSNRISEIGVVFARDCPLEMKK